MKKSTWKTTVFGSCVLVTFILVSCGSKGGGALDCPFYCQKNEQCCEGDPDCGPWESLMTEECMRDCSNMNKLFLPTYLSAANECWEIPCDHKEELWQCITDAETKCSTITTGPVTQICLKFVGCFPGETSETCSIMYSNIVKCYNQRALDTLVDCTMNASCDSFNDDVNSCLENRLGIVFE